MELDFATLGTKFATLVARNSVPVIMDRVKVAKEAKEDSETINRLEEIISELISEKNELIQMVQLYEEQLITQKISDDEIDYISNSLLPILEQFVANDDGQQAATTEKAIEAIKPIISKETFLILQMLGFNFKQAIGEPLTQLLRALISSKIPMDGSNQHEVIRLQQEAYLEELKIYNDEKAFERMRLVRTGQL